MANKPESALDAITSLGSTFVRMISSGGESVKATIANVAKYIIETYASSSLAGSNQSVKSAIDSLNSKTGIVRSFSGNSYASLLAFCQANPWAIVLWTVSGTDATNFPTASNRHFGIASMNSGGVYGFILYMSFANRVFIRSVQNSEWVAWKEL